MVSDYVIAHNRISEAINLLNGKEFEKVKIKLKEIQEELGDIIW